MFFLFSHDNDYYCSIFRTVVATFLYERRPEGRQDHTRASVEDAEYAGVALGPFIEHIFG